MLRDKLDFFYSTIIRDIFESIKYLIETTLVFAFQFFFLKKY
jgi:hypothetical protein